MLDLSESSIHNSSIGDGQLLFGASKICIPCPGALEASNILDRPPVPDLAARSQPGRPYPDPAARGAARGGWGTCKNHQGYQSGLSQIFAGVRVIRMD